MPFVNAKCTNCGGALQVDDCKEAWVCTFCNSPFVVEKAITNYNTTVHNTYNVHADQLIIPPEKEFDIQAGVLMQYKGASAIVEIPEGVTEIASKAFEGLKITEVHFPRTLKRTGNNAFYACHHLHRVVFSDGLQSIDFRAFAECTALTSIELPQGLRMVAGYAFYRCNALASVTFPETVEKIDDSAFEKCSSLTSVTLPYGVTVLGSEVFCDCTALTSITLPAGVKKIGDSAFEKCSSLTSITLPGSVAEIPASAFAECTSLANVSIGKGTKSIGKSAFRDCTALTSIEIPDSVTDLGEFAFDSCRALTDVTIGEGMQTIGEHAFSRCFALDNLYLSNLDAWCSIRFVSRFSFSSEHDAPTNPLSHVSNLYLQGDLVTELELPRSVTQLQTGAFYGCYALRRIVIPDCVTTVGCDAFTECTAEKIVLQKKPKECLCCKKTMPLFSKKCKQCGAEYL